MRTAIAAAIVTAVVATLLLALEGGEVVVLETRSDADAARRTRVWIVDAEGAAWVEAATPERAWLQDLQAVPVATLHRADESRCVKATPVPGAAARTTLRERLRARYGWRDVVVGWLQDTSAALAVRLDPCEPPAASS